MALGTAAITWLGGGASRFPAFDGRRTACFLAYLTQLFEPLNQLSHVGGTVAACRRRGRGGFFEILDTPEEVKERPDARPILARSAGAISFEGVSFAYDRDREVLRDIRFSLQSGESAAIIGASGAGKTTLLHLLPAFF